MSTPPNEPGMLTPLEAALTSPPLRRLSYAEAFVDKILTEYEICHGLKFELWNTLEGAAHNLRRLPSNAFVQVDAKEARKKLREVHKLATQLEALLSELAINAEPCGGPGSGTYAASEERHYNRRAVWALTESLKTSELFPFPLEHDEFPISAKKLSKQLTQLADIASSLANSGYARASGPNTLMPLKVYTLTILRFWHLRAGKSYSRSHDHYAETSNKNPRRKTTVSSKRTKFVPFLKACLGEIERLPPERSLQTAMESAIAQLEGRSDEIPLAVADWNFV